MIHHQPHYEQLIRGSSLLGAIVTNYDFALISWQNVDRSLLSLLKHELPALTPAESSTRQQSYTLINIHSPRSFHCTHLVFFGRIAGIHWNARVFLSSRRHLISLHVSAQSVRSFRSSFALLATALLLRLCNSVSSR